jgi:hypothetical protein
MREPSVLYEVGDAVALLTLNRFPALGPVQHPAMHHRIRWLGVARRTRHIESSRLMNWRTAWAIDRGEPARHESSKGKP